ncbi:MAG: phosphoserine phosphatase SerB [Kiloniellales bacterium]
MDFVLTVIGDPATRLLGPETIQRLRSALDGAGLHPGLPDWLAQRVACDLPFGGGDPGPSGAAYPGRAIKAARAALGSAPFDLAAQPLAGRSKRLLVADMESTVIGQELLDELAEIQGLGAKVAAITARTMAGELDFAASLKERVAMLKGMPAAALDEVAARIAFNPGAETLIATLRAKGVTTALVSGGFEIFAARVAKLAGFDRVHANRLEIVDGKVTGKVGEPVLDRNGKRDLLLTLARELGIGPGDTMAVGDGSNDLEMIRAAGLGVAYRGKPVLREAAAARIDHGDLTALLFLQGYREQDFSRETVPRR